MTIDVYIILSSIALICGAVVEWRRLGVQARLEAQDRRMDAMSAKISALESKDDSGRISAVEGAIERLRRNL